MFGRHLFLIILATTWCTGSAAQSVKSQDIDLDAFARKVARETIRSLRDSGALKGKAGANQSGTTTSKDGGWQTSTSMETTHGQRRVQQLNSGYDQVGQLSASPARDMTKLRKLSGWEAGIEAVIAKPLLGQEHGAGCCYPIDKTPNHDAKVAPRFWLGWMGQEGYGFRARYFHLDSKSDIDQGVDFHGNNHSTRERFKYATTDLEFAYHDSWVNWDVIWSLGARRLDMKISLNRQTLQKLSTFNGAGPMAGIELRRRTRNGLAPFAAFRGGFVTGEVKADSDVSNEFIYIVDDMFDFYEASAGMEYNRQWGSTTLFFKGAFEAMFMRRAAGILDGTGDQQEDNQHLAILGGSLTFGARF